MPKKRNGRKRPKKTRRGNYGLSNTNSYSNKSKPVFQFLQPHQYITFKYGAVFAMSNAATTASQQTMILNSCFDPDRTGTGHQPYGWDSLAGVLYNRYRVLQTRWKVTFGPANNTVYAVVIPVNNLLPATITTAALFEAACETPRARSSMVPATGRNTTMAGKIALNVLAGTAKVEYLADDRFEAVYSASPTEVISLVVSVYNPNASTVVTNILIEMEFETDLHDPITVAQS